MDGTETSSRVAWHYTTGPAAAAIRSSGVIQLATIGVEPPEKPVAWFSTRQFWEPTVRKTVPQTLVLKADGSVSRLWAYGTPLDGILAVCGSAWRFGVPTSRLLSWRELIVSACIHGDSRRHLLQRARAWGADPSNWYGSLTPVPAAECIAEVLTVAGEGWRAAA